MRLRERAPGVLEGHARIVANPDVVRLEDNGVRKVMLRFDLGLFRFEAEIPDAETLARDISYAQCWVREG